MIINGKEVAEKIIANLKDQPAPKKILAAVLVGKDPASISFLKQKEKIAKELGVDFRLYEFGADMKNDDLRREIGKIARQSRVGGIIAQLPLPGHVNRRYVLNAIPLEKDIDVLSERAQEAVRIGQNPISPPAVAVVEEILKTYNLELKNLKTAVVGLGFLVGKPISEWLKGKCAELHLLDIGDDFSILREADLVITGVGKPGLIKSGMLKDGAAVIDFGYSVDKNDKIRGDFNSGGLKTKNYQLKTIYYTPKPGGTGPILVTKLFENFYTLNS